jgi:uncharacterized protein YndB with AHSA1/START domain
VSVTSVDTDYDNLAITVIADFEAPVDRVWELWSDPRKLERWWGPPGYPATFETHDLTVGGEAVYFMTGPGGERSDGMWRVTAVDPPTTLRFTDACGGTVSAVAVDLTEREGGTRMEMRLTFESRGDMDKVVDRGTVEGLEQAVAQMDGVLA